MRMSIFFLAMMIFVQCAKAENNLYILTNNGVIIKADIEQGKILSTYNVYPNSELWESAYIYDRNTKKYETLNKGIFKPLSEARKIIFNNKYDQIYILSNFKGQIFDVIDPITLLLFEKQPEGIQSKCLELGKPIIYYPGSHDLIAKADTIIPGFKGAFLGYSNDLIYDVIDNHLTLVFNSNDFSFSYFNKDSTYYLYQQPVYDQDGKYLYTNCPYNDKDPDLCFVLVDANTLNPLNYYRCKGGIGNFYIYGGERFFYPYYIDNQILVILRSTRNLGIYDLKTNSIEDLNIGVPSGDLVSVKASNDGALACGISSSQKDKIYIFDLKTKTSHQIDLKTYADSARFVGYLTPNITFSRDNKYLAVSMFMNFDPPDADTLTNFYLLPQNELLLIIDIKSYTITREIPLPYGGVVGMTF